MSWLFSRALVEEYSAGNCSDGEPSAQLNENPTPQAYLSPDRMTAFSRLSRFGMTFAPLTGDRGEELLTLFLAGFPVKTSAPQEKAQESTANVADSGEKWRGSFAKYNPDSRSWKTAQCSLLEDSDEFSETWPRWGLMRDGECWELTMLARHTNEIESGLWPTPCVMDSRTDQMLGGATVYMDSTGKPRRKTGHGTASMGLARIVQYANLIPTPTVCGDYNRKGLSKTSGDGLATYVAKFPTPTKRSAPDCNAERRRNAPSIEAVVNILDGTKGGRLNPEWVEWLMGWPIGVTALLPLEMGKFQEWQQQHGESFSQKDQQHEH